MYRTALHLPRHLSRRTVASIRHSSTAPFGTGPAPPRLPKEEQEVFERLQRQSTGAFSTPRSEADESPWPTTQQHPSSSPASSPTCIDLDATSSSLRARIHQSPASASPPSSEGVAIHVEDGGRIREGEEVHPHLRRGAPPEFEGDVNPRTGEVGGPKNEPLRWGHQGDWSFNGRVTDF